MAKRMILMVVVMIAIIAGLGFVKFKQFQAMAQQFAAMQPPPDAVTTIVAAQEEWPSTLNAIGTVAAVQGVTVSADLPGIVDRITFESGKAVKRGRPRAARYAAGAGAVGGRRIAAGAGASESRAHEGAGPAGRSFARGVRHRGGRRSSRPRRD